MSGNDPMAFEHTLHMCGSGLHKHAGQTLMPCPACGGCTWDKRSALEGLKGGDGSASVSFIEGPDGLGVRVEAPGLPVD